MSNHYKEEKRGLEQQKQLFGGIHVKRYSEKVLQNSS